MYRAKEAGRNNFQYSTPDAFDTTAGRLSIEASLHHALEREELVVHYQPIIDLGTHAIVGAEALVRWRHPQRGMVGPDDFIPMAEETGHIRTLTEHVLSRAIAQQAALKAQGFDIALSVNMSGRLVGG